MAIVLWIECPARFSSPRTPLKLRLEDAALSCTGWLSGLWEHALVHFAGNVFRQGAWAEQAGEDQQQRGDTLHGASGVGRWGGLLIIVLVDRLFAAWAGAGRAMGECRVLAAIRLVTEKRRSAAFVQGHE